MLLAQKKIWFAAKVLMVFAIALFLWQWLTPAYNTALAWTSTALMHLFERPDLTLLKSEGDIIRLFVIGGEGIHDTGVASYGPNLHFNIVILTALILSTPVFPVLRRASLLLMGLGILFLTHVAYEMASAQLLHVSNLQTGGAFQVKFYYQTVAFFQFMGLQLIPILIWGGLYLKARSKETKQGGVKCREVKRSLSPR